jgi:dephospho-CoA kinase
MRIIAFTGPKLSGKDTAAKCLFKHNIGDRRQYFRKAMFAQGVKNYANDYFGWTPEQMDGPVFKESQIALWEGGPVIEPRWFMMDEANGLRDRYHREIHARRWERHCNLNPEWGAHVATDLRFPDEEVPAIRRAGTTGSLIIYIQRDEAEAALKGAQEAGDAKALNPSEIHYARLKELADIVITNNAQIHDLHNAVNSAVHLKFGHWVHWNVPYININPTGDTI